MTIDYVQRKAGVDVFVVMCFITFALMQGCNQSQNSGVGPPGAAAQASGTAGHAVP